MKPIIHPMEIFISKDRLARLWFWLCVLAVAGFTVERQRLLATLKAKPLIIALDANDTYYLPASMDFEAAKEVHATQTKLAMQAFFDRHPNGVDNAERLKRLFSVEALKKAEELVAGEAAEFQEKEIHQKVELGRIQVLQVRDNTVVTGVEGQLIRSGSFRNKPLLEAFDVNARFKFELNPDMRHNGRFPTVVKAFDVEIHPKS